MLRIYQKVNNFVFPRLSNEKSESRISEESSGANSSSPSSNSSKV